MVQKTDETITGKKKEKEEEKAEKKKGYKLGHHVVFDIPSTFLEPTPSYVEELVMYQ